MIGNNPFSITAFKNNWLDRVAERSIAFYSRCTVDHSSLRLFFTVLESVEAKLAEVGYHGEAYLDNNDYYKIFDRLGITYSDDLYDEASRDYYLIENMDAATADMIETLEALYASTTPRAKAA